MPQQYDMPDMPEYEKVGHQYNVITSASPVIAKRAHLYLSQLRAAALDGSRYGC